MRTNISMITYFQVHSTVRQRWLDGDEFIVSSMKEVADIAAEGKTAILEKNFSKLAELMNHNFDLRRYETSIAAD